MRFKIIVIALVLILPVLSQAQDLDQIDKSDAIKVSGNLSAGTFLYFSKGIENRQSPYGYSLTGRVNINIMGVDLPFYASINDQKTNFNQPFSRFGVSPKYKWVQLHGGWRTMNFSQFTLSNMNFLGGGIDLTPGKFRFSAMHGLLKQSTLLGDINFGMPQYQRKATAFKLGYGDRKNYVDLIGFKAADDLSSLVVPDTITSKIPAQENLVIGIKNHLTLIENRLTFDFDASGSIFSYDIRSDTLPIPQIADQAWMSNLFTPRLSTSANYAGESALTYRSKGMSVAAKYRRVMPEFHSLGSEYILNDVEALTINPAVQLLKNKMTLAASVGVQRNNLDGKRAQTNNRNIASINLSIQPSANYGVNLSYSNFSFQQQVIIDSIYSDSLVVNQLNHNIMIVPRFTYKSKNVTHMVFLTGNYQLLDDQNTNKTVSSSSQMMMANLAYSIRGNNSGFQSSCGLNYFNYTTSMVDLNRIGVSLGSSFTSRDKKLRVRVNTGYNLQDQGMQSTRFFLVSSSVSYQVLKKTSLQLFAQLTNSNSTMNQYVENRIQVTVSQSFN